MTSELKPDYEKFAREICQFAFEGCDASGGEIQEIGIKYGVLTAETFSHEKHVDVVNGEDFEEGDTIYCFAPSRTVPAVPELVRYDLGNPAFHDVSCMMERENGKYVLHSQAAEIIAAKDAEINKLNVYNGSYHNQIIELRELIQAAEAKLKKIEMQFTDVVDRMSDDYIVLKADSDVKDARIKELEAELDQAFGAIKDRSSECEAAEAKLAQYEAQEPAGYVAKGFFDQNVTIYDEFFRTVKQKENFVALYTSPAPAADLRAENERLRGALEFYADTSKYPAPLTGGMGDLWSDCGEVAKKALKGNQQ